MVDPADDGTGWRIEVATGPNAGATVPLVNSRYNLGADLGNDIVLADPSIAGEQLRFEIGPSGASILALAAGVALRRNSLPPGRRQSVASGCIIRVGDTILRLNGPAAGSVRVNLFVAVSIVLVALASAAGYRLATPAAALSLTRETAYAQARSRTMSESYGSFLAHLRQGRSLQPVTLTATGGTLIANGSLSSDRRSDWLEAQQWYDARFGIVVPLLDRVRFDGSPSSPRLDVAAVSTFPIPLAITRDGQRYTVGAVLRGGWVIRTISMSAIVLSRNGETVRVTL